MLEKVFNPENAVWCFIGKMIDLIILTCVWAVCSLPIITMGAATTALHYVTLKMAEETDYYLFSSFFKSFRENFFQATRVWILCLCTGGMIAISAWWYYNIGPVGAIALPIVLILAVLYLAILVYLFPILARCQVTDKQLFTMAFVMAIKNFGWTLFMLVMTGCIVAVGVFLAAPLLVISGGLSAYIHGKVLKEVFQHYRLNLE